VIHSGYPKGLFFRSICLRKFWLIAKISIVVET
jgi:hypothetical protein